jgi:hypothetical protein
MQLSRHASEFYEVSVAGPDAAYANPSLSRIRISVASLKRLICCVFVRILWLNSRYAKIGCLGRYC